MAERKPGKRVVERADGGVEVRSTTRERKLNAQRKRSFLQAVAAGNTIVGAAKLVGVSVQTVTNERRRDPEFDRDVDAAREGYAEHLESVAYQRAVVGVDEPIYQQGKLVGMKKVYDHRLLGQMIAANHKAYKKDDSTKVAVVVAPLSTAELVAARNVGRDQVEQLDVLAREMAEVERERDEQRKLGSGG